MTKEEKKKLVGILGLLLTRKEIAYYLPMYPTTDMDEELDYIKVCVQYILFDCEATHREILFLQKLLAEK